MTDARDRRWEVARAIFGVLLLLVVTLSSMQYYRATTCQNVFNKITSESLKNRSVEQGIQSYAQIDLLNASLSGDKAVIEEKTARYIEAIKDLESVRSNNPIPVLQNCGALW